MEGIEIVPIDSSNREWVNTVLKRSWGGTTIITRNKNHDAGSSPGFVAVVAGKNVGCCTYGLESDCELLTLDSIEEGKGIGSALIARVIEEAKRNNCQRVWLITTNDNMPALRFYQKRGFVLAALYPNAVTESRKLKPTIPLIGIDGIPLRDEIELEIRL